jgi:mannose-1-phosphate guanylyltransferase
VKALVLAAGKGSRLGAAADGRPKPLTAVAGTTPLEHVLEWLAALPVDSIWINVHQHAEIVRRRIGARVCGVPVSYSYEPELLGTAGAWKKLEMEWDETSLVIYGDNLMRFDLAALCAAHAANGAIATVAVFDPERHVNTGPGGGRVQMEGTRITSFVEGGERGMINAGAYVLDRGLAERLPVGFSDFGHDVLPGLARDDELAGHVLETGAYCIGVDTPERLRLARSLAPTLMESAR